MRQSFPILRLIALIGLLGFAGCEADSKGTLELIARLASELTRSSPEKSTDTTQTVSPDIPPETPMVEAPADEKAEEVSDSLEEETSDSGEEPSYPERTVFRYTDKEGNLHFVTGLHRVPQAYRSKMSVVDGSRLSTYSSQTLAKQSSQTTATGPSGKLGRPPSGPWNEGQINWTSYARHVTEARRQQKPVCMVVYTEWCGACRNFKKFFSEPQVAEMAQNFVMVKVDADQVDEVSKLYAPDGNYFPRTLFLDRTGRLDPSIHANKQKNVYYLGASNSSGLLKAMKKARQKHG